VVSSATRYQVEPVARELGIDHVLSSKLEVMEGILTGEVTAPDLLRRGQGALRARARRRDGHRPRGELVLHRQRRGSRAPRHRRQAATDEPEQAACSRSPPARLAGAHFANRGYPGPTEILRTGLAIGSLVPSVPARPAGGAADRQLAARDQPRRRDWGELATALAGVEVRVTGEEHLWSQRPAVFIFNHQSGLDMLLICKLLRRDFVGIAKKELAKNPIFGPLMTLAGTVFVDRFHHDKAIEALAPAIDALRNGLSLAIAPEGTRSTTRHVGRFKKGAFFMAMAAGAPIVPIVLRNTLDALPKNWVVVRPATIDVVVLPPIETREWKREELPRRIAEIEELYRRTLAGE
jgi:putative phosphoserine phosphatase/1-acylglycerol-3-phosphate O-acyltransferase